MPRAMRDTPIMIPTGIAVRQARMNAANTRYRLHQKCSASGLPPWMSPFQASAKLVMMRSGVGRKTSRIQPECVAIHHSANSEMTLTTLIAVLDPSPGRRYPLTGRGAGSGCVVSKATSLPSETGAGRLLIGFSGGRRQQFRDVRRRLDERQ